MGDTVRTAIFGPHQTVVWTGQRYVDCTRHIRPQDVWPVRIAAHAFGQGLPRCDLWLSPDHAIYVDDCLIPAKHLVNGTTVVRVPVPNVTYFHVELARHDVVQAEGLATESYLDTGDRINFTNHPAETVLHPDFPGMRHRDQASCVMKFRQQFIPLVRVAQKAPRLKQLNDRPAISRLIHAHTPSLAAPSIVGRTAAM